MSEPLLNDLRNFKNNYEIITNNNIQLSPDDSLSNIEINETDSNDLKKILLTRKRMLDINYHKNDIKNKKIYTMFVFIIIIVLVMTIIHFKNSK